MKALTSEKIKQHITIVAKIASVKEISTKNTASNYANCCFGVPVVVLVVIALTMVLVVVVVEVVAVVVVVLVIVVLVVVVVVVVVIVVVGENPTLRRCKVAS